MKIQETCNNHSNIVEEQCRRRTRTSRLQNLLKNYSNQDCATGIRKNYIGQWYKIESPKTNSYIYAY